MTQGSTFYVYDPWGRRIWKQYNGTSGEAYFYGVTGQKLETYNCTVGSNGVSGTLEGINTYFVGRMISEKGVVVATDRLGSVRGDNNGVAMSYFPWGEERGAGTADNRTKFAGYYRDMPGQDYANARYYSAVSGSFWSPDPGGVKTAHLDSPTTWNRFLYASGDPINRIDPRGKEDCDVDDEDTPCFSVDVDDSADDGSASGDWGDDDWVPLPQNPSPKQPISPAPLPNCADLLRTAMTSFLTSNNSPLLAQDPNFVSQIMAEAAQVNVDPRLFVAETEESTLGASHVAQSMNNPFGIKHHGKNVSFGSVGDAVISEGSTLNRFVNTWRETISQMYSGLPGISDNRSGTWIRPPAYCQGSGCQAFGQAVSGALQAMGGNPNSLQYPSGQIGSTKCKD